MINEKPPVIANVHIRNLPRKTKDLLYKKAVQKGLSLSEMVKTIIRNYLHEQYPNETIE